MLPLLEWHQIAWPAFPSHEVDFWNRKFGRTVAITPQSWNDLPSSASNTVTNRAAKSYSLKMLLLYCMFINDDTQTPNLVRPFKKKIFLMMMTWNSPVQNQKNVSFYIFPDLKEGIDKVAKSVYNYGFKVTPFAHVLEKKLETRSARYWKKLEKCPWRVVQSTFNSLLYYIT